ncbi:MAG: molybdopterin-synthase adenylyltransferase MoeB [Ahrensia sp.]|nr:molybdopterin-synthase adenylyltransferase MoeB [Ahrensia sp.]
MSQASLNQDEIERYARHLVLPEIGGIGQQKLKAARVLVIGAGGLGAPAIQYLAAAGVGTLTLVDDDEVSLSNLQRQVVHGTGEVGSAKVESAARDVKRLNPHVAVVSVQARFNETNAVSLLMGQTVALDCSDNFETRYAAADACADAKVSLVSAAVSRFDGSITTLRPWEDDNPSYRDLFPQAPEAGIVPSCAEAGIMGAVTGMLGTMQALEAIKLITGAGQCLIGKLLMINGLTMEAQTIRYKRRRA